MDRRHLLKIIAALPFLGGLVRRAAASPALSRTRPADPAWPSAALWDELERDVGGRLIKVQSPLASCVGANTDDSCERVFKELKNPYYLGDEVALTQTLGWVDAWTSEPSVYAVAAESAADVVAVVKFAKKNNLRLVVKGGGHSYKGTSNSADSLLIWTRKMNGVSLHDDFVGAGCAESAPPTPAVTIGAGAIWGQVYSEVTVKGARYAQGGGCLTVGVVGLLLGGGFGSFSKAYGMAAASLLEAEIVTADGEVKIANACTNPDLFWALKGGGGAFGVVTRVTLRTHELPQFFGGAFAKIKANSAEAYRRLIGKIVAFYGEALFNPHWGEQIVFRPDGFVAIAMVFEGLGSQQAETVWKPFFDWLAASPQDFAVIAPMKISPVPARYFWSPFVLKLAPGVVLADDRPGAPSGNIFWAGNLGETGHVLHAYQSLWLPASLLKENQREALADALFAAAKNWGFELHFNKGLAGAPEEAVAAARETAMNPAVCEAFALVISAAEGPPAYPGVPGHEPDVALARKQAEAVEKAMSELRKVAPKPGAYLLESNFFEANWQEAYWGANYARLAAIKQKYDPDGLFFVHHGVGSEGWSADGFTRTG
jgi:hypothetical protein